MIKLVDILLNELEKPRYIYQKDKDEADIEKRGFTTIQTDYDPLTGKTSWDVIYTDDIKKNKKIMFAKTYQTIKKLADEFEDVSKLKTYAKDSEIKLFANVLRKLEDKFKEYLIKKGKSFNG